MSLILNWAERQCAPEHRLEIPVFGMSLVVYCSGELVTKTEWRLRQAETEDLIDGHWKSLQAYLLNPVRDLKLDIKQQGSIYRHKVWAEICNIPFGQTLSYSALAAKIDSGARAVANACRDNPYPGIIPCHRVVAVSGLGGFMGHNTGECLQIKRKLLASEFEVHNSDANGCFSKTD